MIQYLHTAKDIEKLMETYEAINELLDMDKKMLERRRNNLKKAKDELLEQHKENVKVRKELFDTHFKSQSENSGERLKLLETSISNSDTKIV